MIYPPEYGFNPLFPQAQDFTVINCGEYGMGVICHRHAQPGDLLAEFTGEVLDHITQHTLQIDSEHHLLDRYFLGFLLHSCEPNVELDMQSRTVTAIRPIAPDDYLSMDYASTEDHLFRQFVCLCGTPSCRGWVRGRLDNFDNPSPLMETVVLHR